MSRVYFYCPEDYPNNSRVKDHGQATGITGAGDIKKPSIYDPQFSSASSNDGSHRLYLLYNVTKQEAEEDDSLAETISELYSLDGSYKEYRSLEPEGNEEKSTAMEAAEEEDPDLDLVFQLPMKQQRQGYMTQETITDGNKGWVSPISDKDKEANDMRPSRLQTRRKKGAAEPPRPSYTSLLKAEWLTVDETLKGTILEYYCNDYCRWISGTIQEYQKGGRKINIKLSDGRLVSPNISSTHIRIPVLLSYSPPPDPQRGAKRGRGDEEEEKREDGATLGPFKKQRSAPASAPPNLNLDTKPGQVVKKMPIVKESKSKRRTPRPQKQDSVCKICSKGFSKKQELSAHTKYKRCFKE